MPIRVILIDDEQTILDGMKQLINWSEHGFQLIGTFSSPLKALDFSLVHAIDIVVTDVMMPELNGIELSRLLKQQQPETQILILSSYDEFDMVKDSFKEGVADYLLKPRLSPDYLLKPRLSPDFFLNSLTAVSQKIKKKPNKSPITNRYEQICENLSQQIAGQTRPLLDPLLFEHTLFFLLYTEKRPFSSKQGSKQK
ncbi:TPA: response regulator [Enterococcus faecium]|nr:response regulator [Enterococcus faecium]